MDSNIFNSEEDESEEDEIGEWSNVQPRVWTFDYLFSIEYLEAVLSRLGLEDILRPLLSQEGPQRKFLRRLKLEQYSNRIRFHTWSYLEGSGIERYELFDDPQPDRPSSTLIWRYDFQNISDLPLLSSRPDAHMQVALEWTNDFRAEASKREIKPPYRYITWLLGYTIPRNGQREEVFFEVPLDVQRLGDNYGHPENGDRQIYCTHSDPPFSRMWECQSGQGNQWEWEWMLTLQTFDASRTVRRER